MNRSIVDFEAIYHLFIEMYRGHLFRFWSHEMNFEVSISCSLWIYFLLILRWHYWNPIPSFWYRVSIIFELKDWVKLLQSFRIRQFINYSSYIAVLCFKVCFDSKFKIQNYCYVSRTKILRYCLNLDSKFIDTQFINSFFFLGKSIL